MTIRLHEIEFGSGNVKRSKAFYQSVLGLPSTIEQDGLNVFDAGTVGLDFNTSSHFPQGITCISFITDDLAIIQKRLEQAGIPYEGPTPSHLGMTSIQFKDPDGYIVKLNTIGKAE